MTSRANRARKCIGRFPSAKGVLVAGLAATLSASPQSIRAQDATAPSAAAPPVIKVASRTASVPSITLKLPAALHVGGVVDNPDNEFNFKNSFLLGAPLKGGGLAVVDGFKVRLYDKAGKQRAVVGTIEGGGPHEFKFAWRVCQTRGDTLFIHDDRNSRMTVMMPTGQVVHESPTRGVRFTRASCLDDGTIIVTRATEDSANLQMAFFLRRKTDGTDAAPIGIFPISYKALGPVPYVTIGSGHEFVVADPNVPDIAVRDLSGRMLRTYHLAEKPTTAFADVATASTAYAAQGVAVEQAGGSRSQPKATRVLWPLYKRLEVDPAGNLWLQDMTVKATDQQSWTRINTKGAVTGRLTLPPQYVVKTAERTEVMSFTANGVLVRSFDADGAAHFYGYLFN
ncbi:MAG: hypothetical protein ABI120_08765 [Gemmatimonadaceae bacterium]